MRGLRNQNGEHLVNLCESHFLEKQLNLPSRTLFPVESTNSIKTKATDQTVVGCGGMWAEISLMNAC